MERFFKILVYGYGNPGRQDDGLGNELVKRLEAWALAEGLTGIAFDSNYQLNIEDASSIADMDLVVFADASTEEIDRCILTPVDGETEVAFTSHAASPGYIVKLAGDLFGKFPAVYLLHIKGYEWEFREGLSREAGQNLEQALEMMKDVLRNPASYAR